MIWQFELWLSQTSSLIPQPTAIQNTQLLFLLEIALEIALSKVEENYSRLRCHIGNSPIKWRELDNEEEEEEEEAADKAQQSLAKSERLALRISEQLG